MVELTYDYLATRVCVHAEENYVMECYYGYQTLEFWKRFVESCGLENLICGLDACIVSRPPS